MSWGFLLGDRAEWRVASGVRGGTCGLRLRHYQAGSAPGSLFWPILSATSGFDYMPKSTRHAQQRQSNQRSTSCRVDWFVSGNGSQTSRDATDVRSRHVNGRPTPGRHTPLGYAQRLAINSCVGGPQDQQSGQHCNRNMIFCFNRFKTGKLTECRHLAPGYRVPARSR